MGRINYQILGVKGLKYQYTVKQAQDEKKIRIYIDKGIILRLHNKISEVTDIKADIKESYCWDKCDLAKICNALCKTDL